MATATMEHHNHTRNTFLGTLLGILVSAAILFGIWSINQHREEEARDQAALQRLLNNQRPADWPTVTVPEAPVEYQREAEQTQADLESLEQQGRVERAGLQ